MWPDRVSNLGLLAFEANALPTALHRPAKMVVSGKSVPILKVITVTAIPEVNHMEMG